MGHKEATFEHPSWSDPYSRQPHLPPALSRNRRSRRVNNSYKTTHKSEFRVNQTPRLRSRRRANYKTFAVLAPTIALGLLMVRSLLSFLPTSFKAVAPQQFSDSPHKVAVLPSPSLPVNTPATPPVVALRRAIVAKESSVDPQSLNPHSKALGLAQIMPANLSNWSKSTLGYRLTPDQFLNSPDLQLKIIDHKLSEYWQKALADSGGNEDMAVLRVASNWYSGNPERYKSTLPQRYKGRDGRLHRYPSVAEYSNSVLKKYRQYRLEET